MGPRQGMRPPPPIIGVIDHDKNGVISSEEIKKASEALLQLDHNKDGQLTREEILPPPPNMQRGPQGQQGPQGAQQWKPGDKPCPACGRGGPPPWAGRGGFAKRGPQGGPPQGGPPQAPGGFPPGPPPPEGASGRGS